MIKSEILNRRSIVCFSDELIEESLLLRLFEAAKWAPSAYNQQPWRFILGRKGDETYNLIYNALAIGNKEWAITAPVLFSTIAEEINPERQELNKYAWHDTGLAYSNLVYQAISENLQIHPMAGFSKDKIIKDFNIPTGYMPVTVSALGYMGDCSGMPEHIIQRNNQNRSRKSLNEILFSSKWEKGF